MELALRGAFLAADESADDPDERTAWGQRVARHDRAVVLALVARGVALDRAKDLAQTAWTHLWESQIKGNLAYIDLPGLAIRQALLLEADERRKSKRQEGLRVLEPPVLPWDPHAQLLSRDQLRRIEVELEVVSPSARKVFLLAHSGQGLSHGEIALRTGLSLQRVRHILCELRERLRPLLEEHS